MAEAGHAPDLAYGLARGSPQQDLDEAAAFRQVLGDGVPVSGLNGQLGLAAATSGLYAVAAALLGLRHGEIYPAMGVANPVDGLDVVRGSGRTGDYRSALVLGCSQLGSCGAVVLTAA
jgi:3-oxoacyl-(acyl-carrier-protein) synthase